MVDIDIDEHGRPKAPIQGFPEPSPERLQEIERKREEAMGGRPTAREAAPRACRPAVPFSGHMSQRDFDAFEYPKIPEHMTPEWMSAQIELERVDPRQNPNLLVDENSQEFWDNLSRKPYAKAILRSEQHWVDRKKVWLRQYERVEIMNRLREEIAEELEDCSMEVRRLVAPIFHYKICEASLWNAAREAHSRGVPLSAVLEREDKLAELRGMRQKIDVGGRAAAEAMMDEFSARAELLMDESYRQREEARRGQRVVSDTDTVTKVLNFGQKCRKDGYIEWHKGNAEEALSSWRQADEYLRNVKLPDEDEGGNKMIEDLHLVILKNIAQAAIQLGSWTEALAAADGALRIDDQDHKAWFRRACALEGLGRLEEQEAALARIEALVVGRPDRERLQRDVAAKRQSLERLRLRSAEAQRRGVGRAVASGVFSDGRGAQPQLAVGDPPRPEDAPGLLSAAAACGEMPALPAGASVEESGVGAEPLGDVPDILAAPPSGSDELPAPVVEAPRAPEEEGVGAESCREPPAEAARPFGEGDVVVVVEALADHPRGLRGAVVEVDEDGDARVRFEGAGEDELIFRMDFHHLALDASCARSSPSRPQEGELGSQRLRLTKGAAAELVEELLRAYEDPALQRRVAKLARDVRWDRVAFLQHLRRVALEVQAPLLSRWGFESSARGVSSMQLAVQDHTQGDAALRARSDEAARLLYGEMLDVLFPPAAAAALGPEVPPEMAEATGGGRMAKAIFGVG